MTRNSVAKIISWNVDNEAVCASAAKMSTTKGNANEIFEKSRNNPQNTDLIKKVLRSGHKSVIEHAVFSIAFWDVSAFVEQFLIECRLASFTVKSRRYVDFSSLGYIIPSDLCGESLMHYREYMDLLFGGYKVLLEMGIPKEDARFLLPYSFCSNFYCTLNARELANLISSIKYGRGKNIPELQNLAQQLIEQISDIFPALLPEFDCESNTTCDNNDTIWFASNKSIEHIESNEIGSVKLIQAPVQPLEILKFASSASHPHSDRKFDIEKIITSARPRELEHLTYTFAISNMTLSGITHLVRHRMQSIIIPPIECVDHSRCIIPETVQQNPKAKECYVRILTEANEKLAQIPCDDTLQKYGYYFALSGNVMDVMTTMNARELMLFIRLRSCSRAQWEIRNVATSMLSLLRKNFPALFDHYGPSCVLTGVCPEGRMSCGMKDEMIPMYRK
jgi:flavin-dependent thymidylate synthase